MEVKDQGDTLVQVSGIAFRWQAIKEYYHLLFVII